MAHVQGSFATSSVPGSRFTDIRSVAETGSTNQDLLELARSGAPEGIVLAADHQHAGRGRLDRTWSAPPGSSLLVSVLLRPRLAPDRLFLLPIAAGVASVEACAEVAGARTGLKWPNDLVVTGGAEADRKLSGVLAESVLRDGLVEAVVVGMGLNVNWPDELPTELAATATALNLLTGRTVDREELLVAWLGGFDHWISRLEAPAGATELLEAARERSATIGRTVRVEFPDRQVEGVAVAIDDDGHLRVRPSDGSDELTVAVADIVHMRPID